jgi:hypothetical protein
MSKVSSWIGIALARDALSLMARRLVDPPHLRR